MSIAIESVPKTLSGDETQGRPYSFRKILLHLTAYKLFYFLLMIAVIHAFPNFYCDRAFYANYHRYPVVAHSISKYFDTWDGQHYLGLSLHGYRAGTASSAFYPLWPFLIRLLTPLAGHNELLAAMALAHVFSVTGLALLHRTLARRYGARIANRTLILMLAFPGAIFLNFPYSESFFLLLNALWLESLWNAKPIGAGVAGFFAAATRPNGMLLCLPMALSAWRQKDRKALLAAAIPLGGLAACFLVLYLATGNPLEAFAAQSHFVGRHSLSGMLDIIGFCRAFGNVTEFQGFLDGAADRIWFVWLLAALAVLWRRDKVLFAYAVAMGLLPALGGQLMSFTRFALICFPIFLVSAQVMEKPSWDFKFRLLVVALAGVQVLSLIRHMNFYWVG